MQGKERKEKGKERKGEGRKLLNVVDTKVRVNFFIPTVRKLCVKEERKWKWK